MERKAHSRVCAFHHLSSRSGPFAGSLLLLGSELKIDFPKKAPFRWSYRGNLHYQLSFKTNLEHSCISCALFFFFKGDCFFTTDSEEVLTTVISNLERGIRTGGGGGASVL